jgi:hypothetical protein
MKTECVCEKCIGACKTTPGWFAPGEAEKAAAHLNIPYEEFKSKLLIRDSCGDWCAGEAPYVFSPRKTWGDEIESGEIRNSRQQQRRGTCVFLKDDRCQIHPVKPYECVKAFACNYNSHDVRGDLELRWIKEGAPLGMRPEPWELPQ